MDKYYVCRDYMNDFHKIEVVDDYYSAVIAAVYWATTKGWSIVVIHGTEIVYKAKP